MLPIYVNYDPQISSLEEKAILDGVYEVMALFPGRKAWNCHSWDWKDKSNQYVGKAQMVCRPYMPVQLDVEDILRLVLEMQQASTEPRIDLMFVGYDLTAGGEGQWRPFVFGATVGQATVQSVARYRQLTDADRYLTLKATVLCEIGYMLGMARTPERSQCTNPGCLMRQTYSMEDRVRYARDAHRRGMAYCPECLADAQRTAL